MQVCFSFLDAARRTVHCWPSAQVQEGETPPSSRTPAPCLSHWPWSVLDCADSEVLPQKHPGWGYQVHSPTTLQAVVMVKNLKLCLELLCHQFCLTLLCCRVGEVRQQVVPAAELAAFISLPPGWHQTLPEQYKDHIIQLKPAAKHDQAWCQLGPQPTTIVAKEARDMGLFGKSGPWRIHYATSQKCNLAMPRLKTFVCFASVFRMTSLNFTYSYFHFFAVSRTTWGGNHGEPL